MAYSRRVGQWWVLACLLCWPLTVTAASLAEGFSRLPGGAAVVLMPLDIELFSVSAGGILEPQAEWTEKAHANLREAFLTRKSALNVNFKALPDEGDEVSDSLNRLHAAVGQAIILHQQGMFALPTKEGKLDWSLGDEVAVLRARTGADYALFAFVRDSYTSGQRVAMMVVGALLGVGLSGGFQVGYASLVDLTTGRVVWFNRLLRGSGDLRELDKARESCDALLDSFPE
ncbi:hypothetical protein [Accumulibacter sp.]|uniref:Uncharacterized protein n=1 Tax=Candidatus Accumulibacter proximus TaxID=2954385 RepID=A0A935Q0I3_9PROT|nr:hypothetical protein [Accumulibacter sp.]MBK7675733.1 hypothetical protein [Candidatus Accumulibacter proximus]MBL8375880.1 hypothetical protein [Accumulibacter sp.]